MTIANSYNEQASALLNAGPWLVDESRFHAALSAISAGAFGPGYSSNQKPVRKGVVSIRGLLMKDAPSWAVDRGWATDLRKSTDMIREIVGDPTIDEIELDVESPGGTVAGTQELADAVYEARKSKRVVARVEDLAASAAYWVASQADEIEANDTALIGSIGVYSVLRDWSALYAREGVKVDVVRSAPLKGTGVMGAPISDEQRAKEQELIDGMASLFSDAISRGREMDPDQAQRVSTGEMWLASEAKSLGLIDRVRSASSAQIDENKQRASAEVKMANENAELAALRAELEKARAEKAQIETQKIALEAEREAHKAALAQVKESAKARVIAEGMAAGKITPPMKSAIENYAKTVEPEALEAFVAVLQKQTHPTQVGSAPAENAPKSTSQDDAKFMAMFPGVDLKFAEAASALKAVNVHGLATLKDGRIVPVGTIGKGN